jgi:hypothetical protein
MSPLLDGAVFFTSSAILLVIVDGVGSWVGARATVWWLKLYLNEGYHSD